MRLFHTGIVLILLANCTFAQVNRAQAQEQATVTDQEFDEVLALWRKYKMPEPPADAPLVLLTYQSPGLVNGKVPPPELALAFQIQPAGEDRGATLFDGTRNFDLPANDPDRKIETVKPDDVPEDAIQELYDRGAPFRYSRLFAMGVACWSRGQKQLARRMVSGSIGMQRTTVRDAVPQPNGTTAHDTAGTVIWGYWFNRAFLPDSNRTEIVERLKPAIDEFECLHGDSEWRPYEYTRLLGELEAALVPSKAEPGSVVYLIDSLVELHWSRSGFTSDSWEDRDGEYCVPAPMKLLLLSGFDAVPTLIDHVNDRRLTRSLFHPFFNGTNTPQYVGDHVRQILQALADADIQPTWEKDEATGSFRQSEKPLHDWWEKAQKTGEQQYLLECVKARKVRNYYSCNADACILVLGNRHPEVLSQAYAEALTNKKFLSFAWLEAIARSTLEAGVKIRLLEQGTTCWNSFHRTEAMRQIHKLDADRFDELVLKRLQKLDGKLNGTSPYASDEIQYTLLAQLSGSEAVWEALLDLARRAEPAMRIRILGRFGSKDDLDLDSNRRLSFLASFLDDEDVRNRNDDVTQCDPVLRWGTISIRDFAASRIGELLKVEPQPDPEWDKETWSAHHGRVSEALAKLGITAMSKQR